MQMSYDLPFWVGIGIIVLKGGAIMALQIPKPKLYPDVAINQHLIPQCYMREWCYNGRDSVWIYDKTSLFNAEYPEHSNWTITSKKTNKINARKHYHDTKAGCFYMPEEALTELFGFLLAYSVSFNGISLDTVEKMNEQYSNFPRWEIRSADGSEIEQTDLQKIEKYLESSRYTYIETQWSRKYENTWRQDITLLENKVRALKASSGNGPSRAPNITEGDLKKVLEYVVIYDWRSPNGNWVLSEALNTLGNIVPEVWNLPIPPQSSSSQLHTEDKTFGDQLRHELLLKYFDDFLRNDSGPIRDHIDLTTKTLTVCFCLTDSAHPFITSDKPAYRYMRPDGLQEYILIARPTFLIRLGRGNKSEFMVHKLSHDEVNAYNRATAKQGNLLILPSAKYPISSLLTP